MCGQPVHNTLLHARLPLSSLGMDDFTTECSFDSQAMCAIDVLGSFLTCYPWVFVQPGTGRCPVDCCWN